FLGDVILQLLSVALVGSALNEILLSRAVGALKWPLVFVLAIIVIPALQLVPLPQALWSLLPARDVIRESYTIIGGPLPLLPLSMSPTYTWLSGLSLIPCLAIFLGCLTLDTRQRRDLSLLVVALGVISVGLGLLQLAQGPQSPLRFFAVTN